MMDSPQLNRIFLALADPNRRAMVERLSNGPATAKQLAEPVGMRLPSAVKHLKVIEDGGVVVSRKVGRTRTYSMQPSAFRPVSDWMREREAAMNVAFDRLVQAMKDFREEHNS
jgi:DNA-binding transcriptional ArsR family regulator